ncbi:exopolysaccharide Pel transporter PelG [Bacillus sp. AK031]
MAGIGFQLQKLMNKRSFFNGLRMYAHSTLIISGPMIVCILQLIAAQYLLREAGSPFIERELVLAGTLYGFIFSQLISGGFILVLTRYVADQIYTNEEINIRSSLYGILAITLLAGGVLAFIFYSLSPLGMLFKTVSYLFFIELLIINTLSIYLSAVKKYMVIVKGYLSGAVLAIIAMSAISLAMDNLTAAHLLGCMGAGFLVIILFMVRSIRIRFPKTNTNYFHFLLYFKKYPSLFLNGLFYVAGLFGHIFIVWGSNWQVKVGGTFVMAPFYDVPIFYAYLTIIPAMVLFVVSMETNFYKVYKRFFAKIMGPHSLREINETKKKMFFVLFRELSNIMQVQMIFTILAIILGITAIPLSSAQTDTFSILVIGNCFFIIMFIVMQILLYFDDRKGALFIMACYMAVTLSTMAVMVIVEGNLGIPCFAGGFIGVLAALWRLAYYKKNIDYYTYCRQPLVIREERGSMDKLAEKLNYFNGGVRGGKE